MPDIFVQQDTTGVTSYYRMSVNRGLTIQFAFQYTDCLLYTSIGFTSFVISTLGSLIGVFCGKRFNLRMELWEMCIRDRLVYSFYAGKQFFIQTDVVAVFRQ